MAIASRLVFGGPREGVSAGGAAGVEHFMHSVRGRFLVTRRRLGGVEMLGL